MERPAAAAVLDPYDGVVYGVKELVQEPLPAAYAEQARLLGTFVEGRKGEAIAAVAAAERVKMRIVRFSDIHVEKGGLFRPDLMEKVVKETNVYAPDLVVMAGDLTGEGYREQFEEAKNYLDRIECPNIVAVMSNHDAKNVGYRYFQELFGPRSGARIISVSEGEAKVVTLDTTKPDEV